MYKAMYPEQKLTWKEVTVDQVAGGTDLCAQYIIKPFHEDTGTD
jgi:hypothetical protein